METFHWVFSTVWVKYTCITLQKLTLCLPSGKRSCYLFHVTYCIYCDMFQTACFWGSIPRTMNMEEWCLLGCYPVALVWTDIWEESIASTIRVTIIGMLGTSAVTSNWSMLQRNGLLKSSINNVLNNINSYKNDYKERVWRQVVMA
jgi:hypothetical protein